MSNEKERDKNLKYQDFLNKLDNIDLDNKSIFEQYKETQKFITKYEKEDKELAYYFAKRYVSNLDSYMDSLNISLSFVSGVVSGVFAAFVYEIIKYIFDTSSVVTAIISIPIIFVVSIGMFVFMERKEKKKVIKNNEISNKDIIEIVLKKYCEKIENEFDWMEEKVENDRIEKTN